MTRPWVLVSCRQMQNVFDVFADELEVAGLAADLPVVDGQQLGEKQLLELIPPYDGVIAGDDHFTRAVIEAAPRLKVISKWGVGLDAIDRQAAVEHGIAVTNTPNMFDDEVADVAIGYLIMLARDLHRIDRAVRSGHWLKVEGRSLSGRALGVVGLGGIGRATARRALAMGMSVLGVDPSPTAADAARQIGVRVVEFDELMSASDAVALNCPLTEQTRGMVDATALARARPGLLVVNTARGPVVREADLIEALRSGQVAAAALDVFEEEPLAADSPLVTMDNVVLGSHNGSNTREAVLRTSAEAVQNLIKHLKGST